MINITYYLTGRNGDFVSPVFNVGEAPTVAKESPFVDEARAILFPGREDYYVFGALGALSSEPSFLSALGLDLPSPDLLKDVQNPAPRWAGAEVDTESSVLPSVRYHPSSFPAAFSYTVEYRDARTAFFTDRGRRTVIDLGSMDGVLYPAWPESSGVTGGFRPSKAWAANSSVAIYFGPCTYPWSYVAQELTKSRAVTELLSCTGFVGVFSAATSPLAKIGAVVAAILTYTMDHAGDS